MKLKHYNHSERAKVAALAVMLGLSILSGNEAVYAGQATGAIDFSTPPGITLVEAGSETEVAQRHIWTRFGDAQGRTLYIYDGDTEPGKSSCNNACSKEFPPVIALPDATESGDWTLIDRNDDTRQWAYKNKPLYRFAKETRVNEVVANVLVAELTDIKADMYGHGKDKDLLLPPEGWHIAKFENAIITPADFQVKEIPAVSRLALTNDQGRTVYALDGNLEQISKACADCDAQWLPIAAAELAIAVGDFKPVTRDNGDRQWTWQGAPLFTYSGDLEKGEVNGTGLAEEVVIEGQRWYLPVLARHFTPTTVTVRKDPVRGKILSTAEGMPLYSRSFYRRNFRTRRGEFFYPYRVGKETGVRGCDAECLKVWQPLQAPADAHSRGYWEVYSHQDGSKQWMYKGFLQYTNINDQPYQRATANFTIDYVVGDTGRYKVEDAIDKTFFPTISTLAGFMWYVTPP